MSASEDVRSTVRAARTAANAKATAAGAAEVAQAACDKGNFASIDDARAAQTRASMAQSHAIHAAVVEHEAKTAKRRATLALAHDVKCWNVHRKREVLQTALSYAKSQHEATRRGVDAWSCLRDGFVGSNIIPSTHAIRATRQQQSAPTASNQILDEELEAHSTIFARSSNEPGINPQPIVAVDHELLRQPQAAVLPSSYDEDAEESPTGVFATAEVEDTLPLAVADLVLESDVGSRDLISFGAGSSAELSHSRTGNRGSCLSEATAVSATARDESESKVSDKMDDEVMTSSMQSLVNGLMTWGGEDVEVDFALPAGMAASIAMEESGVFGSNSSRMF